MSSLRVALGETVKSIWEPALIGVCELCAANEKPIGALFEQERPVNEIYPQVVRDELQEPGWETFFSSILARVAKVVTPQIPEQLVIIPSKLMGAAWHWLITSHQSLNKQDSSGQNNNNGNGNLFSEFYKTFVKKPTDFILRTCGMRDKKTNYLRYALSQLGIFSLASLGLKYASSENLPGLNQDSDESLAKNVTRGIGYAFVEQATYAISQGVRLYIDFSKEFGESKKACAKALANVFNERFIPGHFLSAVAGSLSTYYLGKDIPKTTAALIGEFPMKIINRAINCHRRRATKFELKFDRCVNKKDNIVLELPVAYKLKDGKRIDNFRFNSVSSFRKFLKFCDETFSGVREKLFGFVSWVFNVPVDELTTSFSISEEVLKANQKEIEKNKSSYVDAKSTTTLTHKTLPYPH